MKVSLVAKLSRNDHRILTRLARQLASGTGWTINTKPMPNYVNYFFPYLEYEPGPPGLQAAWFTHRDDRRNGKVKMWQSLSEQVNLRTTSAAMYVPELSRYGQTALITPPLDREKFAPARRAINARVVVGTSGYTYPGGRKGEELLLQLAHSQLARHFDIVASGRGWPVKTVHHEWAKLQEFYQGLDVYLCTSLIEGVGYGPLEAMACGVPVVVPAGVGVFDELPDVLGLYRYQAGDYRTMEEAVERAISEGGDRAALRDATERFTVEAWISGHVETFERAFGTTHQSAANAGVTRVNLQPAKPWREACGLYVVAYGEPARKCADRCLRSFRQFMPSIPIALASDRTLGLEDILIEEPEADVGARSQKVRIYDLAPKEWDYVLYLDADTETIAPIPMLFQALEDGWELVICKNPGKFALASNMGRSDNTGECQEVFALWGTDQMIQLNGGVFAFRRCQAVKQFFADWVYEWKRFAKRDQGALLRAFWHYPVRVWLLGNEWNLVEAYDNPTNCAGIMHYPMTARRWRGIIKGRSDSEEAWAAVAKAGL